jgi:hypothetical protein
LEFILTFLVRQSAGFVAPSVTKSVHLGTKGCLFDFTANLGEARFKALQAFVCSVCREKLAENGADYLADDMLRLLDTKWLGARGDANSPACVVANLGYDLFLTRGITATVGERVRALLLNEATAQIVKLIGAVFLAALLVWLGIASGKK